MGFGGDCVMGQPLFGLTIRLELAHYVIMWITFTVLALICGLEIVGMIAIGFLWFVDYPSKSCEDHSFLNFGSFFVWEPAR